MNRFLISVLIGIPTAEAVGWLHPVEAVGFSFTFELCFFPTCSDKLEFYFDEYTFRYNRRTSKSRGLLFY